MKKNWQRSDSKLDYQLDMVMPGDRNEGHRGTQWPYDGDEEQSDQGVCMVRWGQTVIEGQF
jgi:hypothetical protein